MSLKQTSDGGVASELPLARQHVRAAVEMQIRRSVNHADSCPDMVSPLDGKSQRMT